jgi:hypothetical protein
LFETICYDLLLVNESHQHGIQSVSFGNAWCTLEGNNEGRNSFL